MFTSKRSLRAAAAAACLLTSVAAAAAPSLFDVVRAEANRISVARMLAPLEAVALPGDASKLVDAACDLAVERFVALAGTSPAGEGQPHGLTCYFLRGGVEGGPEPFAALEAGLRAAGFDVLQDDAVPELLLRRQAWRSDGLRVVLILDAHLAPDLLVLTRVEQLQGE